MVKLADAPDSKSGGLILRVGSSPTSGTKNKGANAPLFLCVAAAASLLSWQSNGNLSREGKKVKSCANRKRRKIRIGASTTAEAVPLLLREKALLRQRVNGGVYIIVTQILL